MTYYVELANIHGTYLYQPSVHKAELPFSDAILVGDTSYLSGQIGVVNELTPKHKKFTADLKC